MHIRYIRGVAILKSRVVFCSEGSKRGLGGSFDCTLPHSAERNHTCLQPERTQHVRLSALKERLGVLCIGCRSHSCHLSSSAVSTNKRQEDDWKPQPDLMVLSCRETFKVPVKIEAFTSCQGCDRPCFIVVIFSIGGACAGNLPG